MKKSKLPKTDSIQELAEFWDTHDLTDFEDEVEEVAEPVFVRGSAIKESPEAEAVQQLAQAKGISGKNSSTRGCWKNAPAGTTSPRTTPAEPNAEATRSRTLSCGMKVVPAAQDLVEGQYTAIYRNHPFLKPSDQVN